VPLKTAQIKTVYVAPVKNHAYAPQIQGLLTRQLREEIGRSGYLKLEDKDRADAHLEVTVETYGRSIGAVFETDPDTAKSLSLSLSAKCCLVRVGDGKLYLKDQAVSCSRSIQANDFAQTIEYQKMPELTREMAKKIVMLVANVEDGC
jgi:hypothetical protein